MGASFTKLFSSITESTVWGESHATRIVWITMLAMADRRGRIAASIPGLANRARVTLEEAEHALGRFLAPDKYSRTPDNDGRRIEPIDGGWKLLNYEKYREMRDHEARLEYQREWDRTHRSKSAQNPTEIPTNPTNSDHNRPRPTKAEAEAEEPKPSRASRSGREGLNGAFADFWAAYPRKKSKGAAERAWLKVKPDEQLAGQIVAAVERAKTSADWLREGGRFIPHPATWLNAKGWMDEGCAAPAVTVDC